MALELSGVHPKVLQCYDKLNEKVFAGQYLGMKQNKEYGTWRAVFEVEPKEPKNQGLLQLFDRIRDWIPHCYDTIWRGFSGAQDYSYPTDWHPCIWAPESCELPDSFLNTTLDFEITDVEFFYFNESFKHDYEVGVNISVEIDTFGYLGKQYEKLEGCEFGGRYIGEKCDTAGIWRPVFEVDPDDQFNHQICGLFDNIRDAWNKDQRTVHKSFTDANDSHQGYNWCLWIWASQDSPRLNCDCACYLTITETRIDNGVAEIDVE